MHEDRTNESAAVELAGGQVLQSMRSYHREHKRALAVSADGGASFGAVRLADDLPARVCQGSAIRLTWGGEEEGVGSILLHSHPTSHGVARDHHTIFASLDEGATWPVSREIETGETGYSNLVPIARAGRKLPLVGLLFERGGFSEHPTVEFATFELDWVLGR